MSDITVDQIIGLVEQLTVSEQADLMKQLEKLLPLNMGVTREEILAQQERRLAEGNFDPAAFDTLQDKYARPNLDLSFEDIESAIHEHNWEDEIDEFFGND